MHTGVERCSKVDPDRGLNHEHQDDRQAQRLGGQQQDREHGHDGDEVDLALIDGDGVLKVGGAHALAGEHCLTRIMFVRDTTNLLDQLKCTRTLVGRGNREHQTAVVLSLHQIERVLFGHARGDIGTRNVNIALDGLDLGERLELIGECLLLAHLSTGNEHNVGIGVAKDLLDLVHILTKPRIRTKNVRSAVVVRDIAGGRCHTRRVNHGEDHDGSGDTDLEHQTGELTQRRDKGPVLRFLHKAIELNEHRRNKGKDRYQADGDTLCKGKTKVGADLKLHGGKRDKADADRATARKHGDRGQAARLHHVFGNAAVAATLLVKAVQQKDREVQRDGNLQNRARRIGDKADLAKDEVGAPVDKHRDA